MEKLTDEKEQIMSQWMEEFLKRENEKKKIRDNMTTSLDYIHWLIQYTEDKKGFTDEDYFKEKDAVNKEHMKHIDILFEGIDKYARKNYIYPDSEGFEVFYRIKIEEIGFEIGIITGQGSIIFCQRVEIDPNQEFIDFMDIVDMKKQENVNQIVESLNALSDKVIETYQAGVPIPAMEEVLKKTIGEIRKYPKVYQKQKN